MIKVETFLKAKGYYNQGKTYTLHIKNQMQKYLKGGSNNKVTNNKVG